MKYKLIVFDIAGTTLQDDEEAVSNAFKKVIKNHGILFNGAQLKEVMGYRKKDAIRMLLEKLETSYTDELINKIHHTFLNTINEYYKYEELQEVKGISNLFRKLKASGYIIALNTGFSRSTVDIILSRLEWKKNRFIDATIASDEVERGRPHSDMINKLAEKFNIADNSQIVKIGDTPSDLLEGANAGCGMTIGVLYGTHEKDEFSGYPYNYLAKNTRELGLILLK